MDHVVAERCSRTARQHRAAGAGVCVDGHVRQLRRAGGCIRRGGTASWPATLSTLRARCPRPVLAAASGGYSAARWPPTTSCWAPPGCCWCSGLVMVFSASSVSSLRFHGSSYFIVGRQVAWVFAACRWRSWRRGCRHHDPPFGLPLLTVSVALLLLTYVPGLGVEVSGNQNWLDFGGPFRIQPSEFAKLGLVVWGAAVLAGNGRSSGRGSSCGAVRPGRSARRRAHRGAGRPRYRHRADGRRAEPAVGGRRSHAGCSAWLSAPSPSSASTS